MRRSTRTSSQYLIALALAAAASISPIAHAEEAPPATPPPEAEHHASGLVSQLLQKGYGQEPADSNDYVSAHFTLWTADGVKFQSTYGKDAKPAQFLLEKVAPGWSEGIQQMVAGEKRRLWIPEELGPRGTKAASRGDVICDVELMAIRRITNIPPGGITPPKGAQRSTFGAYSVELAAGTGKEKGETGIGVLAHFTLWTQDGRVHDSTVLRNRPTFFIYDRVMPAFADKLKNMVAGEKRRVWIPGNIANGNWVGGPKGMLIFDIEIVQIMSEDALAPPQSGAGGTSTKPSS